MDRPLKPCPFCGSAGILERDQGSYGYTPPRVRTRCSKCEVALRWWDETKWEQDRGHYDTSKEALVSAINLWNQRVQQPDQG